MLFFETIPGLSLALQPWAGVSQRLRRYSRNRLQSLLGWG